MSGTITARGTLDLYAEVLRDPRPVDWLLDPMESLAFLTTPNRNAFDNWFEAAAGRGDVKEALLALDIAERSRRHRFFTSLGFNAGWNRCAGFSSARDRLPHEAVPSGRTCSPDIRGTTSFRSRPRRSRVAGQAAAGGRGDGGIERADPPVRRPAVGEPEAGDAVARLR